MEGQKEERESGQVGEWASGMEWRKAEADEGQ